MLPGAVALAATVWEGAAARAAETAEDSLAAPALEENFVVLVVPFFEREVLVFLRSGARYEVGRAGLLGRQKAVGPDSAAVLIFWVR